MNNSPLRAMRMRRGEQMGRSPMAMPELMMGLLGSVERDDAPVRSPAAIQLCMRLQPPLSCSNLGVQGVLMPEI